MYKELIKPTEISIKDKKKLLKGSVTRAAIFAGSKVIDVKTEDNETCYFIFYKDALIYGEKLDKVETGTFIHQAFNEGIILESHHPLLKMIIPKSPLTFPNKNKLFSQLQKQFPLQEVAYITTTLDAFFTKDQLIEIMNKIYFHYRRNGNYLKSFQVVQMLSQFEPTLKSAKTRLESLDLHSYYQFYNSSNLSLIQKKDPLFVELHCFKNRFHPEKQLILEDILSQQDHFIELTLLWLEKVKKLQKAESIEKYTDIALRFVTMEEWILLLSQATINPFQELPEAKLCMEEMVKKGNAEQAALLLLPFIGDLPNCFNPILSLIWENSDSGFVLSHLDDFITFLQKQPDELKQSEEKMFELAIRLLEKHDLKTVSEQLLPIQKIFPHLWVIRKINEMITLVEDPDRMMELGDLYAEFKQFDKAIDCFFWEMELQPQNPSPVRKISKMYQYKGMLNEVTTYQRIYEQLKSNQQTG